MKLIVVTASPGKNGAALSLILQNTGPNDVLVAIIGPPTGVDGGQPLGLATLGGVAYCDGRDPVWSKRERNCLEGDAPELSLQQFTSIERGGAVPFNITLNGPYLAPFDKTLPFSFSLSIALVKDPSASDSSGGDTLQNSLSPKPKPGMPQGLRFITLGVPAILFPQ